MPQVANNSSAGLLVEVLFENIEPDKRVEVLARTLRRTIAEFQDEASVELIRRLHAAFGLDFSVSVSAEAEARGVYTSVINIERMEHRREFCDLLMAAYPFGSLRQKNESLRPVDPKPAFMGTRKEILRYVVWEWDGKLDTRGQQLFEFIRRAVGQGEDQIALLDQEKQMVFSIIRERLQCPPLFTEAVLREWMRYLDEPETRMYWI